MGRLPVKVLDSAYTAQEKQDIEEQLQKRLAKLNRKMVVVDDDPTGIQTVQDVSVYTSWDETALQRGFEESQPMFFILTNSRSFSKENTVKVHLDIGKRIVQAAGATGKQFMIFSRSDSTLRGHYPMETQSLAESVEQSLGRGFDGEILVPFFEEGGRYTIDDVHYISEGNELVPVGETEFARDKSFGFCSSDLKEWCQEKTEGAYCSGDVISISLETIHNKDYRKITSQLMGVHDFGKIIVNAKEYTDIRIFAIALMDAVREGKEFMFRTAASLLNVFCPCSSPDESTREWLNKIRHENGGVLIVGSHVNKTTQQLECLRQSGLPVDYIEFNQHRILEPQGLEKEAEQIAGLVSECISEGRTAAVYTRRERLDMPGGTPEEQLEMSVRISEGLVSVIRKLETQPGFIIAKGGITSSDVMTKALKIRRGWAAGQIRPGIPILRAGDESRYPDLPYIIFPGNVGDISTLRNIVADLISRA